MSRIGKNAINVPDGVSIEIAGQLVTAKGKLGALTATIHDEIIISQQDNVISVAPKTDTLIARKMWGTSRSVINNLVEGVSAGYTKKLEITGVGYRAQMQGSNLQLQLGFSHDVDFIVPDGIKIVCADQTHIAISGSDKQQVGQVAAKIRSYRPPEPYKGKGVRYENEYILRKEGKKK